MLLPSDSALTILLCCQVSAFQALDANQSLTHLNISGNNLGADGDKAVYGLLKYSMALKELVVGSNEFGQVSVALCCLSVCV